MLENLVDEVKHDLIKTFTNPSDGMMIDDVINVNDWVNKADEKKNQLDKYTQKNYNEIASKMIRANNADLLSQMFSNNKIRDSLILEKVTAEKEHKSKQLAEKIQPDLDVYLRDDDNDDDDNNNDDNDDKLQGKRLSYKWIRLRLIAELN